MNTLYFLRQPFTNDPKDTWRIASGRAFDFTPEADRMAVVPAAELAAAQQEIARLRAALEGLTASYEEAGPNMDRAARNRGRLALISAREALQK